MSFVSIIILVLNHICNNVDSFTVIDHHHHCISSSLVPKRNRLSRLQQSISNNDNNNDDNENYRQDINLMRKMLESSWKEETMGSVPTTPEKAAYNAAESILNAIISNHNNKNENNIFMIDISLPSLDPMSGNNVYDDIGAVEFCVEFAKRLNDSRDNNSNNLSRDGGVMIVVKDEGLMERSERHIRRRNEDATGNYTVNDEDNVDENYTNEFKMESSIEYYDDFADFHGSSSIQVNEEFNESNNDIYIKDDKEIESQSSTHSPSSSSSSRSSTYKIRFGNMLGKPNSIPEGSPSMINDVVKAVAKNTKELLQQNKDDYFNHDVLILVAPMSQQELVGVRWLVSKYKGDKIIIIFNNKLHPLPNELMMAETCYSVFPMIARSSSSTSSSINNNNNNNSNNNPKVVLLRRYPKDWEIYIDSNEGLGFEIAGSVKAKDVGMKGPSMDWIAGCVKRYMEARFHPK